MAADLFLNADVDSGPIARQDTIASAAIDFHRLMWHAGSSNAFAPWSLSVEEMDGSGNSIQKVPHQWYDGSLYWKVPGSMPPNSRRRFRIGFASEPGPKPPKNNLTDRIVLTDMGNEVQFSYNKEELCRYRYRNVFKPLFFPVNGPDGNVVRDIVHDNEGHYFHHGIWVGYGSMDQNGVNLWCESDDLLPRRGPTGRMVHESFERFNFGTLFGFFRQRLAYQKPDGYVFTREWRTVRVSKPTADTMALEFEITLQEPDDTGPRRTMFSCRVASSMRIYDAAAKKDMEQPGKIESGVGWTDYSGPVESGWNGVATFDHPRNPEFPKTPSASNYGLMSLSRTYPTTDLHRGATVTYRYRSWVHRSDAQQANIQQVWEDYAYPCLVTLSGLND